MSNHVHTAGIIPIANLKCDYEFAYPDVLMPIEDSFTAIQKSVYECAMAGCNTIWIVANNDLAPIVRKVIGDWVYDPVYYERFFTKFYADHRREVPIYYAPIHPKDRQRRDSYGWSILHGVNTAFVTSYRISKWIIPQNYYVSFPMSIFDVKSIREYRRNISTTKNNFFIRYDNKTAKDGEFLSFTLKGEDFKACRNKINKTTTREYLPPSQDQQYPSQKLPLEERWSARSFSLAEVLSQVSTKSAEYCDIDWYYDISTWDGYREYMSSDNLLEIPKKELTLPRTHVNIPYNA